MAELRDKFDDFLVDIFIKSMKPAFALRVYWKGYAFVTLKIVNLFGKQIEMNAKDRVTPYVCTNRTSREVDMSVIGRTRAPKCFRLQRPPIT